MSWRSAYDDELATQFHLLRDDVDAETIDAVAKVLRLTDRCGSEAWEVATDVLAALAVVQTEATQ